MSIEIRAPNAVSCGVRAKRSFHEIFQSLPGDSSGKGLQKNHSSFNPGIILFLSVGYL
jgi:hypothetical protein